MKIVKPDHAAVFSALLFGFYLQREVKGIPGGGRLGRGPLPRPRPFFVILDLTYAVRDSVFPDTQKGNKSCRVNPDQLCKYLRGPARLNFPAYHHSDKIFTSLARM